MATATPSVSPSRLTSNVSKRARNKFWWVDLNTTSLADAQPFYAGLFNWTFAETKIGDITYVTARRDGCDVAGVVELTDEMRQAGVPAHFLSYVLVDDVQATVTRARTLGGRIVQEPFEVGDGIGWMATIADPTGAVLAVWQAGEREGASLVNVPGALSWIELRTRDLESAREFYCELFGWTASREQFPGMEYWTFSVDGTPHCGMLAYGPDTAAEVPAQWNVVIGVDDADRAVEHVNSCGGRVLFGPFDTQFGRTAQIVDPLGASLTIMQPPAGGWDN